MPQCQILVTGGGTSGHVNPLVAVIQHLKQSGFNSSDIAWIGSVEGPEKTASEELSIPYYSIPTGKLRRYLSRENISDFFKVLKGIFAAYSILKELQPRIVFSKGGFVALPVTIAASLKRIPIIIHESDTIPGLANKLAFYTATTICTSYKNTLNGSKFSKKVVCTGNPIRKNLLEKHTVSTWLGEVKKPLLLFIGGSQGAKFINDFVRKNAEQLKETFYIVHQHGPSHDPLDIKTGYKSFSFIDNELPAIYEKAELVVTRAGSIINELAAFGKATILIPLPSSANNHQYYNAKMLQDVQAGIMVQEKSGDEFLLNKIMEVHGKQALQAMLGTNIRTFYKEDAAKKIAEIIQKNL